MSYKRKKSYENELYHTEKRKNVERKTSKIEDCKQNLQSYLLAYTNITDPFEFWKFYDKFKVVSSKSSNEEKSKIVNIDFVKNRKEMYDRLPMLSTDDQWIPFDNDEFNHFLTAVKIYHDFQQKTSFNKLKKIKKDQTDLPIAKHKEEITENIHKHKVLLIAGIYIYMKQYSV